MVKMSLYGFHSLVHIYNVHSRCDFLSIVLFAVLLQITTATSSDGVQPSFTIDTEPSTFFHSTSVSTQQLSTTTQSVQGTFSLRQSFGNDASTQDQNGTPVQLTTNSIQGSTIMLTESQTSLEIMSNQAHGLSQLSHEATIEISPSQPLTTAKETVQTNFVRLSNTEKIASSYDPLHTRISFDSISSSFHSSGLSTTISYERSPSSQALFPLISNVDYNSTQEGESTAQSFTSSESESLTTLSLYSSASQSLTLSLYSSASKESDKDMATSTNLVSQLSSESTLDSAKLESSLDTYTTKSGSSLDGSTVELTDIVQVLSSIPIENSEIQTQSLSEQDVGIDSSMHTSYKPLQNSESNRDWSSDAEMLTEVSNSISSSDTQVPYSFDTTSTPAIFSHPNREDDSQTRSSNYEEVSENYSFISVMSEIQELSSNTYSSPEIWPSSDFTTINVWLSSHQPNDWTLSSLPMTPFLNDETSLTLYSVSELSENMDFMSPSDIDTLYSAHSSDSPHSYYFSEGDSQSFYDENTGSLDDSSDTIHHQLSLLPSLSESVIVTRNDFSSFSISPISAMVSTDGIYLSESVNSGVYHTDSPQLDLSPLLTLTFTPDLNGTSSTPIDSLYSEMLTTDIPETSTPMTFSLAMDSSEMLITSSSMAPNVTEEPLPDSSKKDISVIFKLEGDCTAVRNNSKSLQQLHSVLKPILEHMLNQSIPAEDISFQDLKCHPFSLTARLDKKFSTILAAVNSTLHFQRNKLNVSVTTIDGKRIIIRVSSIETIPIDSVHEAGSHSVIETIVITMAACIIAMLLLLGLIVFIREMCCKNKFIALTLRVSKNDDQKQVALTGLPRSSINSEMKDNGSLNLHHSPLDGVYSTIEIETETTTSFMNSSDLRRSNGKKGKSRRSFTRKGKSKQKGISNSTHINGTARAPSPYGLVVGLMGYKSKGSEDVYAVPQKPAKKKKVYGLVIRSTSPVVRASPNETNQTSGDPVPPRRYYKRYLKKSEVTDSSENLVPNKRKINTNNEANDGVDNPSFITDGTTGVYDSKSSLHI